MFARLIALLTSLSMGLTLSALTHAQTAVAGQTTHAQALQEEARQMPQLIGQLEARVCQIEVEKSAATVKRTQPAAGAQNTRDVMLLA